MFLHAIRCRPEMFGSAARKCSGSSAGWKTSLSGSASPRSHALTRRSGSRSGGAAQAMPIAAELAVLADDAALEPRRTLARPKRLTLALDEIGLFEQARVYVPIGSGLPTSGSHVAGSCREASRREGRRGGARPRARLRAAVSPSRTSCSHPVAVRCAQRAGWSASCAILSCWKVSGAAFELDVDAARGLRARTRYGSRRRRHLSRRAPGSRVRRRRRRAGCRSPRRARGGR